MAHELSVQNGVTEMFSGNNKLPWHKLGTVVAGLLSAKEAIEAAHLNWDVVGMPVTVNGKHLPFTTDGSANDTYQGIVRVDNGDCLGLVKGRYEIIQNSQAFEFFDSIVGQGKAVYETAGALRGGKQVWILAKYNGEVKYGEDMHRMWCLLVTSHDGSQALSCQWVSERVVCANTLSIALSGKKNSIKIRHTANWADKESEAKRVLGLTDDYFSDLREQLSALQDHSMNREQMDDFVRLLYPARDENKIPTITKNTRGEIANLFDKGAGNKGETRWDALNAVSDWADHMSTLRGDNSTRLESSVTGSAAELKQKAFDLLSAEDFVKQLIESKPHTVAVAPTPLVAADDFNRLVGR